MLMRLVLIAPLLAAIKGLSIGGAIAQDITITPGPNGHIVHWIKPIQIIPLRMLAPNSNFEIMQIPLGKDFQTVLAKLKSDHPSAKLLIQQAAPVSDAFPAGYILAKSNSIPIAQGLQTLPYVGTISAVLKSADVEDTASFGFSSPVTNSLLLGVRRTTNFKAFNSFPTEQQITGPFVTRFGAPSRVSGMFLEWVFAKGSSRPASSQEVGDEQVRNGNTPGGDTGCAVVAGNAADGNIWDAGRLPGNRFDVWRYVCRNYDFYASIQVEPGNTPGRFRAVSIVVADLGAVREAAAADLQFVQLAKKRALEMSNSTYKP